MVLIGMEGRRRQDRVPSSSPTVLKSGNAKC